MSEEGLSGWLTMDQAAEKFGVRRDTLRRAALEGRLPAQKMGGRATSAYLVKPADVEQFLTQPRRGRRPQITGSAPPEK